LQRIDKALKETESCREKKLGEEFEGKSEEAVMMAQHLRGAGQALGLGLTNPPTNTQDVTVNGTGEKKTPLELKNRAGESKSPYVKAHGEDPVKWQIWGDEAIQMAKKENRLLFVSIGYNACHCKF
jgi:hypothetical protein